jgi:hypothetical protein
MNYCYACELCDTHNTRCVIVIKLCHAGGVDCVLCQLCAAVAVSSIQLVSVQTALRLHSDL